LVFSRSDHSASNSFEEAAGDDLVLNAKAPFLRQD
jgi:hypothetical protein